jgi:lysine decarboxylase/arginine decarboxylase
MHVLIIDDEFHDTSAAGESLRALVNALEDLEVDAVTATTYEDGWQRFLSDPAIGCMLVDWDLTEKREDGSQLVKLLIEGVRRRNHAIPILLATDRLGVEGVPVDILGAIDGYIWTSEDTPDFMAGRIRRNMERYLDRLLPPFFNALTDYAREYHYAWHTPGHMGGVAFLRSPAGRLFFDFYGENVFRADLSISVPELGSLNEHSSVIGQAERNAAQAFDSDRTYFVLNGTSTANKIVWHGRVCPGDVVLVDRNCHKSLQQVIQMIGAIPIYFVPTRNRHGIIGPVPAEQFTEASIRQKLRESPLVEGDGPERLAMTVLTNSTYDGLCYDSPFVEKSLSGLTKNLHFDEAWYGYARFHEVYAGRYGMHSTAGGDNAPVVFATQSTHKLLAALSQCSMLHVRDRHVPETHQVDHERFNEAFMMHTSTSPQYSLIASLDVATRMMQHGQGRLLLQDAIEEAVTFRRKMSEIRATVDAQTSDWWFDVFQPPEIQKRSMRHATAPLATAELEGDDVTTDTSFWLLDPKADWHGYEGLRDGFIMLDPTKVTVMTPGLDVEGQWQAEGIPAAVVSAFLQQKGIVVEKTGNYAFLVLFSIGISRGKSGTLLSELFQFKKHCDRNHSLEDVLPDLVEQYPDHYEEMTILDLAGQMHSFLHERDAAAVSADVYGALPEQVATPSAAFQAMVSGQVDRVPLAEADGRVAAVMIVPYPPGIPVIMPGERFDSRRTPLLIKFLTMLAEFDSLFPGFEHEVHGVEAIRDGITGHVHYEVDCIRP